MTPFICLAGSLSLSKCLTESEEAQSCWISRCQWTSHHPYFEQKKVDWFGWKDFRRQNIKRWQEARRRGDCWLVPALAPTETQGDEAGSNKPVSLVSSAMRSWNCRLDAVRGRQFTEFSTSTSKHEFNSSQLVPPYYLFTTCLFSASVRVVSVSVPWEYHYHTISNSLHPSLPTWNLLKLIQ